jgi:hypothetical protein
MMGRRLIGTLVQLKRDFFGFDKLASYNLLLQSKCLSAQLSLASPLLLFFRSFGNFVR